MLTKGNRKSLQKSQLVYILNIERVFKRIFVSVLIENEFFDLCVCPTHFQKKKYFHGNPLACNFDPSDPINGHGVCMSYCYFLPRREKYLARLVLQTCLKNRFFSKWVGKTNMSKSSHSTFPEPKILSRTRSIFTI